LDALRAHGDLLRVHELQGDLAFTTAAEVARAVLATARAPGFVILEMSRVTAINEPAEAIIADLRSALEARGTPLLLAGATHGALESALDLEAALKSCENRLLERIGVYERDEDSVPLAACEIGRGLSAEELRELEAALVPEEYPAGSVLAREGDTADDLIILSRGRVSVFGEAADGGRVRLAALSAGMAVGEQAFVDGRPRAASVVTDTPVLAYRLSRDAFDRLPDEGASPHADQAPDQRGRRPLRPPAARDRRADRAQVGVGSKSGLVRRPAA